MRFIPTILTLLTLSAQGQIHTGARFTSMAYAAVALQDVWSIQQNQAGLCAIEKPIFSLGSTPNFGHGLYTQSIVGALPYRNHAFGFSAQRYGIPEYSEHKVGVTYARRFNNLSVALHGNYHQLYIQNYSSVRNVSIEAGLQYRINQNLCLGLHIANPGRYAYNTFYIPTRTQAGASYQFSDKLILAVTLDKMQNDPTNIRTGLEYNLTEWTSLRGGIATDPFKHFVGVGIRYNQFRFDLATDSHPVLGYAPQLALSYEL